MDGRIDGYDSLLCTLNSLDTLRQDLIELSGLVVTALASLQVSDPRLARLELMVALIFNRQPG